MDANTQAIVQAITSGFSALIAAHVMTTIGVSAIGYIRERLTECPPAPPLPPEEKALFEQEGHDPRHP